MLDCAIRRRRIYVNACGASLATFSAMRARFDWKFQQQLYREESEHHVRSPIKYKKQSAATICNTE
jgi:fructoselysine-6-P-deglycase FrlB-like protein